MDRKAPRIDFLWSAYAVGAGQRDVPVTYHFTSLGFANVLVLKEKMVEETGVEPVSRNLQPESLQA